MTKTTKSATAIDNALAMLREAGAMAADAGNKVSEANSNRATALDQSIAALCTNGLLDMPMTFDVTDRAGQVIEHCTESIASYLAGFKLDDGKANRSKQTAFRAIVLPAMFGVTGDQSPGAKAVWALATIKAFPAACALVSEGMNAAIVEGKLEVSGGAGEYADALRNASAKSTSALAKVASGKTGSDRAAPQNDNGTMREASPSEIAACAVKLARIVAKGDETLCSAALSCFREIAKIVAANPDAFAED
jgi:hypothetical protein